MKLSVIVVARSSPGPVLRCLESIRATSFSGSCEIVLVNALGPAVALEQAGAGIIMVAADPGWTIARQRAAGVRKAAGDVIAILHERYRVLPGWTDAIMRAHAKSCDVAAGGVLPAAEFSLMDWAIYLSEYSHLCTEALTNPLDRVGAEQIPGGNVSYKRSVLALSEMASALWELDFHAALFDAGARFVREVGMRAEFASPYSFREYLTERYAVSRAIAARRAIHLSRRGRFAAAAARIALPVLVVARIARRVSAARVFRARFMVALPWILFFAVVQAFGEIKGYVST